MTNSYNNYIKAISDIAIGVSQSVVRLCAYMGCLLVVTVGHATDNSSSISNLLPMSKLQDVELSQHSKRYQLQASDSIFSLENISALGNNRSQLDEVRHDSKDYVSITRIYNDTAEVNWVVNVSGTVIDTITYTVFIEQQVQRSQAGYTRPSGFPLSHAKKFKIPPGSVALISTRIQSEVFFSEPKINIAPAAEFRLAQNMQYAVVLSILGALLALAICNLFIYTGARELSYVYYSLYLLCYFVTWFLDFQLGFSLFKIENYHFNFIPFLLLPVFGGLFSIQFLELATNHKRLANLLRINGFAALLFIPFSAVYYPYAKDVVSLLIMVWIVAAFIAGILQMIRGFRPARYFVLAFLCLLLPIALMLAKNQGLELYRGINIEFISLIGGALDAILLSFALAERTSIISKTNTRLKSGLKREVEQQTEKLSISNQQLALANQELRKADNAKNQFLATVSHEIRTPLTSIIGFSEALMMGDIETSQHNRVFTSITTSSRHLLRIINDILDLSKVQENRLEFEYINTDLVVLLNEVFVDVEQRAAEKSLGLTITYDYPFPIHIQTDPTRLKQILLNITSNAIKFTEQGSIDIFAHLQGSYLLVTIKDTGIGLSAEETEHIFYPFSQADVSIARRFGGSGLGLSISKQLAQGLGGDVNVNSEKGVGSCFTITIPINECLEHQYIETAEQHRVHLKQESYDEIPLESDKTYSQARILIADDHADNAELIKLLLERMEIAVDVAFSGEEVIGLATNGNHYDLILMDISMPVIDGIEALAEIQKQQITTPVIALTAHNLAKDKIYYKRLGFSDHISKPIERINFVEKIGQYLRNETRYDIPDLDDHTLETLRVNYVSSLKQELDKLRVAQAIGDYNTIRNIAHRIKGSAGCFGYSDMSQQFSDIERQYQEFQNDHQLLESGMRLLERL